MSNAETSGCNHPEHHQLHICQLKKKGLNEEVSVRTSEPAFVCHNCNAVANKAEDLCNGSPFVNKA
jgi:hypothetical protein